jgi:4-amino-4-deoxy-L-arabinose transferase-like glycosyltransferase
VNRRHLVILVVLLFVGLGLRATHLVNHRSAPLGNVEEVFESSDMHAFTVWARRIADGDWLCRDSFHPYMDWMAKIAPLETFETWWGGKEIYHQTPLYTYLLAISYAVFDSNLPLLILQVLGSTVSLLLIFLLGRRMLDTQAGLIAMGIAVFFAPAIVLDSIQLRASLNVTLTLLSIWLLMRLRENGSLGSGILTGVCLAASYLLRPTGMILMVAGPIVLLLDQTSRPHWKRWGLGLAAAIVVTIAPFVVRNLIVGAPMLTFSTRGPETVIQANSQTADPGFMNVMPTEHYVKLMEKGHGSVLSALSAAIESWPDDSSLGWWIWHQWQKTLCVFGDYEYANNINFYYYRTLTPGLELLPTFGWFVGLGLVGLVLLGRLGRQRRAMWIPLIALAGLVMGCLLGFAMGRYRMPVAMLLTIPAGATVSLAIAWVRQRQFGRVVLAGGIAVALSFLSFTVVPSITRFDSDGTLTIQSPSLRKMQLDNTRRRTQEFLETAKVMYARGDTAAATAYLDEFKERFLEFMTRTGEQFRVENNPYGLFVLLRIGHRAMNDVAFRYYEGKEIKRANETKAMSLQMKKQADSMTGS